MVIIIPVSSTSPNVLFNTVPKVFMKNSVRGRRYVMVTDAAKSCIDLPGEFDTFKLTEEHDHIGKVSAKVF